MLGKRVAIMRKKTLTEIGKSKTEANFIFNKMRLILDTLTLK